MMLAKVRPLTLLVGVLLALTGFGGNLLIEHGLSGYVLLAHVGLGGAFLVLLALFAIAEAGRPKVGFAYWLFLFFGLGSGLTVLLSMFPLFGTDGQVLLSTLHWWFALGATHVVVFLAVRRQK